MFENLAQTLVAVDPWWAPSRLPVVTRRLTDLASREEQRVRSQARYLRRWPGSDRVQNLHRGEDEFAGPQLPWLSGRQYAIFFFADHNRLGKAFTLLARSRMPISMRPPEQVAENAVR